jgi:hypothetical protein
MGAGRKAEAAEAFKRALKIDPDDAAAVKGYREAAADLPPPPPGPDDEKE